MVKILSDLLKRGTEVENNSCCHLDDITSLFLLVKSCIHDIIFYIPKKDVNFTLLKCSLTATFLYLALLLLSLK